MLKVGSIFLDCLCINFMIYIRHTCEGLSVAKVLQNIHHKFVEAILYKDKVLFKNK